MEPLINDLKNAFSDSKVPYRVEQQGDRVVLSYDFLDGKWRKTFGWVGTTKTFRVIITPNIISKRAKYKIQLIKIKWSGPKFRLSPVFRLFRKFSGRGMHIVFGRRPDGFYGRLDTPDFDYDLLAEKIETVFARNGWDIRKTKRGCIIPLLAVLAVLNSCGGLAIALLMFLR